MKHVNVWNCSAKWAQKCRTFNGTIWPTIQWNRAI